MSQKFEGVWTYRSFFNLNLELHENKLSESSILAEPWTNPATIEVSTSEEGFVSGTLIFPSFPPGVVIKLSGKTIEPNASNPAGKDISAGISLTGQLEVSGELKDTKYQLKGWFIPGSNHLIGTIVCVSQDLANQPDGTSGPWVAFPGGET